MIVPWNAAYCLQLTFTSHAFFTVATEQQLAASDAIIKECYSLFLAIFFFFSILPSFYLPFFDPSNELLKIKTKLEINNQRQVQTTLLPPTQSTYFLFLFFFFFCSKRSQVQPPKRPIQKVGMGHLCSYFSLCFPPG